MGFFSWKTSNTRQSISNTYSVKKSFPVKMIDDKGNEYTEYFYEGYGVFGGMDYYVLTALMNGAKYNKAPKSCVEVFEGYHLNVMDDKQIEKLREEGIRMAFCKEMKYKLPKLVTLQCKKSWHDLPDSQICKYQGYFY